MVEDQGVRAAPHPPGDGNRAEEDETIGDMGQVMCSVVSSLRSEDTREEAAPPRISAGRGKQEKDGNTKLSEGGTERNRKKRRVGREIVWAGRGESMEKYSTDLVTC